MPALPEDIIDRLRALESRVQQLYTAATSRPPLNKFANGVLSVLQPDTGNALLAVTGQGISRPWLTMLPPQDLGTARWPQTTATAWTTVAHSVNTLWQPQLRLLVATSASSGVTGQVRVLVNNAVWGNTTTTGGTFDYTGPVGGGTLSPGAQLTVDVQAMVTSGTGSVYAQPLAMYGIGS
jgi:hypothetical protein